MEVGKKKGCEAGERRKLTFHVRGRLYLLNGLGAVEWGEVSERNDHKS